MTLAIGVTQQDPDRVPRPAATPRLHTLDYIQTARVPITGTFEDYWSARGKNLRHNMKRQRVKLAQDGVSTRLEILTRAEALVCRGGMKASEKPQSSSSAKALPEVARDVLLTEASAV